VELERASRAHAEVALESRSFGAVVIRGTPVDVVEEAKNPVFGDISGGERFEALMDQQSVAESDVVLGVPMLRTGKQATQRGRNLEGRAGAAGFQNQAKSGRAEDELRMARVPLTIGDRADKSQISLADEPPIEYPSTNWWYEMRKSGKKSGVVYFHDFDADGFQAYAGAHFGLAAPSDSSRSKQLNLLYRDGSVQYVDAWSAFAGKLSERVADGGVTVLPEGLVRETGYWNPRVVTDGEGRATITITMPARSTAWQLGARGITTGALTGQATADLTAKKDLFGELKLPLALVDGDSAQVLATVHNDAVAKGKIEVTLKTTIAGKSREEKRTIEVNNRGTHELVFEREIAGSGEAVFEFAVSAAGPPAPLEDSTRAVVPIRPYGIPVFATAGGSATSNITAWVSPPAAMPVRDASLQIVIGPSVERSLLDVVLAPGGSSGYIECHRIISGESALERTTSDLIAAVGLIRLLGGTRDNGSPEVMTLADRVRSSVGFLVSSQNEDGGWHWTAARGTKQGSSDRQSSARGLWALSLARKSGFAVPDDAFNNAVTFLQTAFTAARENDYEGKALLLHSLSTAGRGDFAYANRLYRSRASLSLPALSYLSLAFVELDRKEIAKELLDLLAPNLAGALRTESTEGGRPAVATRRPITAPSTEVQALYLYGLNAVAPGDAKTKAAADWLMSHRAGSRWQPERATGPATLALADYFASARFDTEHYKLKVFVNDSEVAEMDIDGAAGSRTIDVPKELLARGEKLPEKEYPGDARKQRINFELTGRGRFTFNCVLSGFVPADQLKSTVNAYHIERQVEPAPLELDGKEVPRGFDVLDGPFTSWRNPVTELPVGKRAQVRLYFYPINGHAIPEEEREYIVITEPIPSGCTVLEKSVTGQFDRYEVGPGYITFYVGNRNQPNEIRFDLYGYTTGKFRTAPTIVRNYYDPARMMVTQARTLAVLATGEKSKDEYRVSPRELYEIGKRHLERARATREPAAVRNPLQPNAGSLTQNAAFGTAGKHLAELFDKYTLKPEIYKEVAQMLFEVSLAVGKAPDIVRYFEIIKEKWPNLEIPFGHIVQVGAAYRELNEYERSYLVFRSTAEGSFARESEIGGFLESQGEFERSVAVMDRILREYPAEAYIASATYALAQRVYAMAPNAARDPKMRERRVTRVDLIREAVGRLDDFITVWPDDPAADQASFSLASALVELEAWPSAIERSSRFAERFPKSEFLDSFWYIMGYAHFARGEHRAALDMCRRVAEATRTDSATGRTVESNNKWRAIYISGQVHHSLGEASEAIADYTQVADRFPDAKETIAYFTRKAIELPEITTIKPALKQAAQADVKPASRVAEPIDDREPGDGQAENSPGAQIELKFRNVASCELRVYRIDLLKFGLLQRDLANITKINLAGIKPLFEASVELGDGKDYRDRTKKVELPLSEEGAYLVVCRGEDLHASGLVLVTPLVLEVQEEAPSGRVRATVKNSITDAYSSGVQVKVIGSRNDKFKDGATDLRGVFVADGIQGNSTVIARAGSGQYAFHRGQVDLGPPPAPAQRPQTAAPATGQAGQAPAATEPSAQPELLQELFKSNRMIQEQKGKELKDLYEKKSKGVQAQDAF
jgi:tetratricopeptide (TPR) repeat protein